MSLQAIWNGVILAESDRTQIVEGNHYFPPETVNWDYFEKNSRHTICPWKGQASYYDVVVDEKRNPSAAWYYPDPSSAAKNIKDYVAFWNGVKVKKVREEGEAGSEESGVLNSIKSLFR